MQEERLTTLISSEAIADRIAVLGDEIREVYGGEPITIIGVLKGSFIFLADLSRAIGGDAKIEFLGVSSYHGGTRSTGVVRITQDLRHPIEGQHCLIVEDIVDTGLTIDYLRRMLEVRGPKSLRVATLLDKPSNREIAAEVDFVGFTIPDEFVVGYGLDLGELYRNLPYIAVYSP
ncbi:MAG: hypoxanthine phosphoribosyltransferase [Proteobacteria bacterium]|nr:hypoxanthine phosphoribosyltransferase [Pseudomonadota bacterium]MCP4920405.1 hypoxanthine phosphoribosyltransferase [Pseudomonadota bacterium]